MFTNLLKFEAFYQRKQRALLIFSFIFLLYGLLTGSQGFAPTNVSFNSAYQINYFTGIMSLGSLFIVMFFVISGVLRDKRYNSESIIYTTSIKKSHFFFSRFLGVFMFSLLAFTPFLIGYYLGITFSNLDPGRIAEFSLLSYLWPWLIFVVPNTFICTVVMFSISILSKNNIATYVGGVALYFLYMIISSVFNSPLMAQSTPTSPEGLMIAALVDPFGLSAFFEQTQFWVPFQKNNQLLSFTGFILWNRIIWVAVAAGLLGMVYRLFSFRQLNQKNKDTKTEVEEPEITAKYRPITTNINTHSHWIAFLSLTKSNLLAVFKSLPFLAIMAMWAVLLFMDINSRIFEGGSYQDSWYTSTNLLIGLFSEQIPIFAIMLIVFFSGEIAWRTRSDKFNEIIDATPAINSSFFMSNLVTLVLLPVILITSGIVISMLFQIATGYYQFEMGLYLSVFYYDGAQLLFYCILALFVQSIIPNKYVGMGIVVVAIFLFGSNSAMIGIEHPMLRLGFIPFPSYNNMNGFSILTKAFNHFSAYWLSLGAILAIISFKLFQRGIISSFKFQFIKLISHWGKMQRIVLASVLILFLSTGANIYYNTNVVNEYKNSTQQLDDMEAYERKFNVYKDLDRLNHIGMSTEMDLYPSENKYSLKAKYQMKNKHASPISTVFINSRIDITSISFEGGQLIEHDSTFGTYLFVFNPAIQPNQVVVMSYEINKEVKGYANEKSMIKNGTYVTYRDFEPKLGYSSGMEIKNKQERQKRGLQALIIEKTKEEHLESYDNKMGKATFETIVSTDGDQTAISSGKLIKQWTENGRNFYHYKTTSPGVPTAGYFSAKYDTRSETFDGISFEHYYHPGHEYNLDKIAESTKLTLAYCKKNFGDYPFDHLRIAEIPGHWSFGGFAHPGVISMVEDNLYLIDIRDTTTFDLVAKRTIHEVAHQWWGHILAPKVIEGGSIFVEGFAKYTEAVVLEKMYGKGSIWQISETANYRYFRGHSFASSPEPPIYLEDGQNYLAYGKGFAVLLSLRDLLGEQKLNQVLRTLTDRYRDSNEPSITSLDLLDELYKVAPQHSTLIDDWFKRVITYDLSVVEPTVKKLDNGQYQVSVTVKAKRFEMQENGESIDIDINEPIIMSVMTKEPKMVTSENDLHYYQAHQINKESTQITMIVDELPSHVSIDPYGTRSDENIYDNVVEID